MTWIKIWLLLLLPVVSNSLTAQNDIAYTYYFAQDILQTRENIDLILPPASKPDKKQHNPADTLYAVFNPGVAIVFLVTNENASFASSEAVYTNDSTAYIHFESGNYDAFGTKNLDTTKYFFFQENVQLQNNDTLYFLDEHAEHEIKLIATDVNGTPLSTYQGVKMQQFKIFFPEETQTDLISFKMDESKAALFSQVSGRYTIFPAFVQRDIINEKIFHIIQYEPLRGLDTSMQLDFDVSDYLEQKFRIHFDPNSTLFRFGFLDGTKWKNASGEWEARFSGVISSVTTTPWEVDFFYMKDPVIDTGTSFLFNINNDGPFSYFQTRPFSIINDSLLNDFDDSSAITVRSVDGDLLDYGVGVVNPEIVFDNFISFNDYVIGKLGKSLIKGMFGEDRISENLQGQYLIRDTMGNVLDFGPFGSFTNYILDSPVCSFEVNHEYLIIGETGQGTMHTRIDFMKDDKNPPALTSIKTIDAGRLPRQEFRTGNPASLMISAKDSPYPGNIKGILMDSTYAMISVHQQNNWERLDLFKTGSDREAGIILESDISAYTDQKASYDLKILIRDSSLNKTEYLLKPAFSVSDFLSGNFSRKPSMNDFSLRAYPNPFSRILHLEFEKTPEKAKINIYTLNGKPIMQKRIFDKASTLDLQNLKSGPYLLKVFNEHFQFLKRIIKE